MSQRFLLSGENPDKPTYAFLQTMREGNTAMTYKMAHEIFDREVVQKTISILGLGDAMAASEPQILDTVRHPHIVEVREAQWTPAPSGGVDLKLITFVMPFYPGGSLSEALASDEMLPHTNALAIAEGLFQALHYLHSDRRILHRDIKPANVFLDQKLVHSYLGDLGSAAKMDSHDSAAPPGGTRLYRAPELAHGRYTSAADLYGAGMTLLELFGGLLPYEEFDPLDIEKRMQQGRRAIADRWFKSLPPTVPTPVVKLIGRLTDSNPDRRPRTAAEVLADLSRIAVIDWTSHEDEWIGTWSPRDRPRWIRVRRHRGKAGPSKGLYHMTTHYRAAEDQPWKMERGSAVRISPTDGQRLRQYFDDAAKLAAKRWPVR
ncbi:serine/threonine protein kinase [Mycobacterium europaeum]|uniref:non-specific serine/threonine protein kinase n=1 Tax=Mycobacterium europaeum TaxID=761804 RepID=A0A0U1D337_9MYCO|nr:serine/threonine-protein kinase [Mycobacterium europaeum]CQD07281.1 serine/threonine protein kinase [Mycobacterium europaeum]